MPRSSHQNAASKFVCRPSRLAAQPGLAIVELAQAMREFRRMRLGREHIALHFAKRDRPFGQRAIGVEDRIVANPSSLDWRGPSRFAAHIRQSRRRPLSPNVVDPVQRRLDVRPDRRDRFDVAGALEIHARQHDDRAASHRRCRNRAGTALRRDAPFRRCAVSCRILPGCASATGSTVFACVAARKRRTPLATDGSSHSSSIAVMIPSRPKAVLYQGMPA